MTSIRKVYLSPFPVECQSCGSEITENMAETVDNKRNSREMRAVCTQCEKENIIIQHPLSVEAKIHIESGTSDKEE